ncbi:MAG: hypothetical protein DHS80DRAFT_30790 [Piptocephalis tieghemiana]|nr:MAG: hypothetical protein DHS80DRAFT_30790 [Piptocephalis tieghemiana]
MTHPPSARPPGPASTCRIDRPIPRAPPCTPQSIAAPLSRKPSMIEESISAFPTSSLPVHAEQAIDDEYVQCLEWIFQACSGKETAFGIILTGSDTQARFHRVADASLVLSLLLQLLQDTDEGEVRQYYIELLEDGLALSQSQQCLPKGFWISEWDSIGDPLVSHTPRRPLQCGVALRLQTNLAYIKALKLQGPGACAIYLSGANGETEEGSRLHQVIHADLHHLLREWPSYLPPSVIRRALVDASTITLSWTDGIPMTTACSVDVVTLLDRANEFWSILVSSLLDQIPPGMQIHGVREARTRLLYAILHSMPSCLDDESLYEAFGLISIEAVSIVTSLELTLPPLDGKVLDTTSTQPSHSLAYVALASYFYQVVLALQFTLARSGDEGVRSRFLSTLSFLLPIELSPSSPGSIQAQRHLLCLGDTYLLMAKKSFTLLTSSLLGHRETWARTAYARAWRQGRFGWKGLELQHPH